MLAAKCSSEMLTIYGPINLQTEPIDDFLNVVTRFVAK
jgi:hypothetical protein